MVEVEGKLAALSQTHDGVCEESNCTPSRPQEAVMQRNANNFSLEPLLIKLWVA